MHTSIVTKTLGAVFAALIALTIAPSVALADAPDSDPSCQVISVDEQVQSRDISGTIVGVQPSPTGPVKVYGVGVQTRTVTTTTERCQGELVTTVTATEWAGGSTVLGPQPPAQVHTKAYRVGRVAGHRHCRTTLPTRGKAHLACGDGWHRALRPCRLEDSRNCYWNAGAFGNGAGRSFIDWRGTVHYVRR